MRKGIDCREREWEEISIYGKMLDLTGRRFHSLIALLPVRINGRQKNPHWLCECDCGNFICVPCGRLTNSNTKSCGCLQRQTTMNRWQKFREDNDVARKKFNRLTVLEFVGVEDQAAMYRFACDCGNIIVRSLHEVVSGNTKSCGCLLNELRNVTK